MVVMSLSAREQHELRSIENSLTDSDPSLASLLATFTRLTAAGEMPVRERTRAGWWLAVARLRGRWKHAPRTVGAAAARRPGRRTRVDWRRIAPCYGR
jgi:hypothetical protein